MFNCNDCISFIAPKAQGKKIAITSSDRVAVYLELVDAHMEAGQLVTAGANIKLFIVYALAATLFQVLFILVVKPVCYMQIVVRFPGQ